MTTNRACEAKNPTTCPYHRNGVMSTMYESLAYHHAKTGDSGAFMDAKAKADQFALDQLAVDNGDKAVLGRTQMDIAHDEINNVSAVPQLAEMGAAVPKRSAASDLNDFMKDMNAESRVKSINAKHVLKLIDEELMEGTRPRKILKKVRTLKNALESS